MLPLLIALQFLTSLPIRLPAMPEPEQQGRSLLYYPVVGLLLGALLCLAVFVLDGAAPLLQAALLLTLWVALTGALHLDGLADSADAWLGGFGDRERTLQIMKDPRSGPVAVVVLVLLLLLKFSALLALLQAQQYSALLLAPVLVLLLLLKFSALLARRAMLRRLGGTTGDTAGALLELVECTVLVGLALQL
jgi:adenosylcobinamide-GDP ribazoletransferase